MNPTKAPVTLTVTSRVIRAGSYPAGYQVINTAIAGTVWASANPGMQPGQGTPVNPGTAIVWTSNDDLYLILGSDTDSVAAGSIQVILSYDTQDYSPNPVSVAVAALNTGSIVIEKPKVLYDNVLTGANFATTVNIDVTNYNSIIVSGTLNTMGGQSLMQLLFQWGVANDVNGIAYAQDTVYLSNTSNGFFRFEIPCKANLLSIALVSYPGNGGSISLHVAGSSRIIPAIRSNTIDSMLSFANGLVVPAGSVSGSLWIPPFFGTVQFQVGCGGSGADPTGGIFVYNNAGAIPTSIYYDSRAQPGSAFAANAYRYYTFQVALWGAQTAYAIYNTTANSLTYYVFVTPVKVAA